MTTATRPRRLPQPVLVGVLVGVAGLLAGCSSDSEASACPTPTSAPAAQLGLLPAGLSLDAVGTVTRVVSTQGHVNVTAVTTRPLDDVTVALQDAVTAAGFRPAGMDNEGFEAEVFFTAGDYAAGQALVRAADCDGQWDVDLVLVDPSVLPSASPTPSPGTSASRGVTASPSPSRT